MPISVTGPLLQDHAEIREKLGELKANIDQFNLGGLRQVIAELKEAIAPHALKEEGGLYLIGFKFLDPENSKIRELFIEHHKTADHIAEMIRLLYSTRMTNEDQNIRQLGLVLVEEIEDHLDDEEQVVWPAFERLIDDKTKLTILQAYRSIKNADMDLDRSPLLSLPDQPQAPIPAPASPSLGSIQSGGV
jgi:hemerythrin-like domain-containing protein